MLAKLLKQGMHYASGTALLSIASLISFPILTRYLPVEEYGMLSLLVTLSGLLVAFYKLGLQQSAVRYFTKDDNDFSSSLLYSFFISILFFTLISLGIYYFIDHEIDSKYFYTLVLISFFQSLRSIVISNYTAMEKSVFVNFISVLNKYGALAAMLVFIFFYEKSAFSVLLSILCVDFIISLVILNKWFRSFDMVRPKKDTLKKLIFYGSPLMLAEIIQMLHAFVDRFLIEYYFDLKHVADYVAPYSISKIISDIIFGGLAVAIVPIYMGMWNRKEYANTSKLLNKVSDYFLLIFPISVGGLYLIAEPLMGVAASEKYAHTAYIMPIVFLGVGVFASTFVYSAGLRIKKKQYKILQYVTESLILNLILNVLFLPDFGILASAWATVASYLWMGTRYYFSAKKTIAVSLNLRSILTGTIIGLSLVAVDTQLPKLESYTLDLLIRLVVGMFLSFGLLLLLSAQIRTDCKLIYSLLESKLLNKPA